MKISIEEIIDYQKCPLLYRFRWVDKIDNVLYKTVKPNRYYVSEYFNIAMHRCIYAIFYQTLNEDYPSPYFVKKVWGKAWNKDRIKEDVIMNTGSWRNEVKKKEMNGLNALLNLHEYFIANTGTPILIGKEYIIKIGRHELTGVIDLVREKKIAEHSIIEMIDFKSNEKHNTILYKSDIEVTAASYAFRELFGYKEDRIVFYEILSGKEKVVHRNENDYEMLRYTVNHIAASIEAGIFYPVLNSKCLECPFQTHCAKGKWVR